MRDDLVPTPLAVSHYKAQLSQQVDEFRAPHGGAVLGQMGDGVIDLGTP